MKAGKQSIDDNGGANCQKCHKNRVENPWPYKEANMLCDKCIKEFVCELWETKP